MAISLLPISGISEDVIANSLGSTKEIDRSGKSFESIFKTAMNMLDETNELYNKVEEEEIKFALGDAENTHDLQIAQEKALVTLQYTVAVRDKLLEGYNSIINMQI